MPIFLGLQLHHACHWSLSRICKWPYCLAPAHTEPDLRSCMKHSCRTLHMASDDVHCRLWVTLGQTLLMQTLILSFLWYLVNSVLTALLRLHVKTPCAGMCCTLHLLLILTPSPCIYAELCRVAKKTNTKSLPFPAPTMYAAHYQ